MYDSIDERGSRGGDERGSGRVVRVPAVAELAERHDELSTACADVAAVAAALSARLVENESVPHGHIDATGRPGVGHVLAEGVAAAAASAASVPRAVPAARAGAARDAARPRARPAAPAAYCRENKHKRRLSTRRRREHDHLRLPGRQSCLPLRNLRRDRLLTAA